MKDYQKPVAEEIALATESIAATETGTVYGGGSRARGVEGDE